MASTPTTSRTPGPPENEPERVFVDANVIWSASYRPDAGLRELSRTEIAQAVDVDLSGAVTIAGATASADLTVTPFAYDKSHNGSFDAFVARLHPRRTGTAQLLLSTFLGGSRDDFAWAVSANASGVVTVTGEAWSSNFPTTH